MGCELPYLLGEPVEYRQALRCCAAGDLLVNIGIWSYHRSVVLRGNHGKILLVHTFNTLWRQYSTWVSGADNKGKG